MLHVCDKNVCIRFSEINENEIKSNVDITNSHLFLDQNSMETNTSETEMRECSHTHDTAAYQHPANAHSFWAIQKIDKIETIIMRLRLYLASKRRIMRMEWAERKLEIQHPFRKLNKFSSVK